MSSYDSLRILDFDHLEFAVADLDRAAHLYHRLGFQKIGSRELRERQLKSYLFVQGGIRIVLSQCADAKDPVGQFVKTHGDGVISVAFLCEDAVSALEIAASRGAEVVTPPRAFQRDFGEVQTASIKAFGDVQHTFLSRKGDLFAEGFEGPCQTGIAGFGFTRIDHITNNLEKGKLDVWVEYYERVFGLKNVRFFDIHTQRTGLYSKVMQSPDGVIKLPLNEPIEATSQIQEFIDINHGPGVQHVALASQNIVATLRALRKEGLKFLEVPATYYEQIPKRVPNVTENLAELQELGILVDGSDKGYLLQIFSENVVGPFFYEVIQRKGDEGFGEGNFTALFEAIERDQIRRGVLKD